MEESKCDCDPLTRYCIKCFKSRCKCDPKQKDTDDGLCYKCCKGLCGCVPPLRFCGMCIKEGEDDYNAPRRICSRYHEEYKDQRLYKEGEKKQERMIDYGGSKCCIYLEHRIKESSDPDEIMKWQKYMSIKINK